MSDGVTVIIPAHPARLRNGMLTRALSSVWNQTRLPEVVHVEIDRQRAGAAQTRDMALQLVSTHWVAFLDSDDELLPRHLELLLEHAARTGADFVYPWFEIIGGEDPFPQTLGREFDPAHPVQTTITVLVRAELARRVGFHTPNEERTVDGNRWGEDYDFLLGCLREGARVAHLAERTWRWYHHVHNTSGRPNAGDALT